MPETTEQALRARGGDKCELCGGADDLRVHSTDQPGEANADRCVLACATCDDQLDGTDDLTPKHWFCLKEAIWSEVPAVQVAGYRILKRLSGESWAEDLLGQVYLEESVLAWAQQGSASDSDDAAQAPTLDSNGTPLADGDSVTLIKSLDVKGTNFVAKRGTQVKNIRLIPDDPENVEGRVNKISLVLKTCFLKKSS